MPNRIGICRALDGFRFLDEWHAFLTGLGLEVVVSGPTDRRMIEAGARIAPAELCLPAKVFLGHALSLDGKVDALFVPRLVCRKLEGDLYFGCPKAMALPDMTRALIPNLPLVEFVLDERECSEAESYRRLARELGTGADTPQRHKDTKGTEARTTQNSELRTQNAEVLRRPRIGVVGHDYLVDDVVLSLGLVEKLQELGAEPVRGDGGQGPWDTISIARTQLGYVPRPRPAFMPNWMFEKELIDAALGMAADRDITGLVLATSFACGTSAVTNELIRRAVARDRPDLPVLTVMFDEHAAEAGLMTRLESFVDLLRMRGKRAWQEPENRQERQGEEGSGVRQENRKDRKERKGEERKSNRR